VNDEDEQLTLFDDPNVQKVVPELPVQHTSAESRAYVAKANNAEVVELFQLWQQTLHQSAASGVLLTEKRYARIAAALCIYGIDTCRLAIRGCAKSGWHMGDNPRGAKYTDIDLIFRSHDHVQRFVSLALGETDAARAFMEEE